MDVAMTARKGKNLQGAARAGRGGDGTHWPHSGPHGARQRHLQRAEACPHRGIDRAGASAEDSPPPAKPTRRSRRSARPSSTPNTRPTATATAACEQAPAQRREGAHRSAGSAAQGARRAGLPRTKRRSHLASPAKREPPSRFTRFPRSATVVEPHIVKSGEAIALKPMTIEEAVKDAEFRDRDLLIFRTASGDMFVLHRRRDGQMELVEIP